MNNERIDDYKIGELIAISMGQYSDYCVNGLFVVLDTFNANDELELYAKENARVLVNGLILTDYDYEGLSYTAHLSQKNLIKDVDYRELHMGDGYDVDLTDYDRS